MADLTYARRYARAALELGIEHGDLETWRHDLALLADLWADPGTRAYLEDVRISKKTRLDRCRDRLGDYLSARALNMVLLLVSRGRTSLVPYIARYFGEFEREREETVVARVTSAVELTPEEQQALRQQITDYTGKEVQIETEVVPAILGGLVIRVGDELLDLSISGKLDRMRDMVVGRRAS